MKEQRCEDGREALTCECHGHEFDTADERRSHEAAVAKGQADDPCEEVQPHVAHVQVDGSTWPVPVDVEWVLRYGTPEAREALRLGVASIVSVYSTLLSPDYTQEGAGRMLRRARKARSRHFGGQS